MAKIEVYDPAMCCPTGVCGPVVDPVLACFAADLDWLKAQGVTVERFNLAQQPGMFAKSEIVKHALSENGTDCLPLILVDGRIVSRGAYPTRGELAEFCCLKPHEQLADWPQVVERVCEGSCETDPAAIVNLIMKHPMCIMHSPQHHILVTPAVLAALRNSGLRPLKPGRLASAIERTKVIPLVVCGSRGECGAASCVGALVSILTGATYEKDRERSLALQASAEALLAIAQAGGPRCCKQSVYLALETTSSFLKRELQLDLPVEPRCDFAARNEECKKERCRYYVG